MSETTFTSQIRFPGSGPLDIKQQPVATYNDLATIPRSQRFIGMTVTVMSDTVNSGGEMADYWLVGGTMNDAWTKKQTDLKITGDDI